MSVVRTFTGESQSRFTWGDNPLGKYTVMKGNVSTRSGVFTTVGHDGFGLSPIHIQIEKVMGSQGQITFHHRAGIIRDLHAGPRSSSDTKVFFVDQLLIFSHRRREQEGVVTYDLQVFARSSTLLT